MFSFKDVHDVNKCLTFINAKLLVVELCILFNPDFGNMHSKAPSQDSTF